MTRILHTHPSECAYASMRRDKLMIRCTKWSICPKPCRCAMPHIANPAVCSKPCRVVAGAFCEDITKQGEK